MRSSERSRLQLSMVVMGVVLGWTYLYNLLLKGHSPIEAFLQIVNTISEDFVMGSVTTVAIGIGILLLFTITKLSTQIISNVYSFRILEDVLVETLFRGKVKEFLRSLVRFQDLPQPETIYPDRPGFMLLALSLIYAMSWFYVVAFSEALFFVAWSAGVDLTITRENMLLLPTIALAIPFSARAMAYARYPYAQDYSDLMPAAAFALLLVSALGFMFQSNDQQFFLVRIAQNQDYLTTFLRNGLCLAFIPVFCESVFWLLSVNASEAPPHE